MALSSNVIELAKIIIPSVITILLWLLTTYWNASVQANKSPEEITYIINTIWSRILFWISDGCAITFLLLELCSPQPINRSDVFVIVWSVSILVFSRMTKQQTMLSRMVNVMEQQSKHKAQ